MFLTVSRCMDLWKINNRHEYCLLYIYTTYICIHVQVDIIFYSKYIQKHCSKSKSKCTRNIKWQLNKTYYISYILQLSCCFLTWYILCFIYSLVKSAYVYTHAYLYICGGDSRRVNGGILPGFFQIPSPRKREGLYPHYLMILSWGIKGFPQVFQIPPLGKKEGDFPSLLVFLESSLQMFIFMIINICWYVRNICLIDSYI